MMAEKRVAFEFVDRPGAPPTRIWLSRLDDGTIALGVGMQHERSVSLPMLQSHTVSVGATHYCPVHGEEGTMSRAGLKEFLRSALVLLEGDA